MIRKLIKSIREYKKETILTPLSVTIEVISGMRVIKSFDLEDEEEKNSRKNLRKFLNYFQKLKKYWHTIHQPCNLQCMQL